MTQPIRFYQTGTFTVGNRLLDPARRTVQASAARSNAITSGHRACQGCGEALGARYAIDAAMRATNNQVVAVNMGTWKWMFVPARAVTVSSSRTRSWEALFRGNTSRR